jgi:hypothetical protein
MASKYFKKCSNSLVMEVMQIRTTLIFHLSPVRMALRKGNIKQQILVRMQQNRKPFTLCVSVCMCVCKITFS